MLCVVCCGCDEPFKLPLLVEMQIGPAKMADLSAHNKRCIPLDAPNVRGCPKSSLSLDFGHVLTFGLKRDIGALRVRKKGVLFYLGRVPSYFFFATEIFYR